MQEQRTKIKRLSIWFLVNIIIFVACYLNYRLQLKHRYLYKTLNVGLCLSRAAAMVINFNLLLVWLPMCKYSLTRLAFLANNSLRRQKQRLIQHQKLMVVTGGSGTNSGVGRQQQQQQQRPAQCQQQQQGIIILDNNNSSSSACPKRSKLRLLLAKVNSSAYTALWQLRHWFYGVKLNSISSFLVAVDHCTSLHTICAITITIASVIHTVAHLMNVINFSNNYDPLLSNLNMAEFRGQNPFQLLVSVPGITGSLMVIILILMSLSSVGFIRNSSYDLFQIFHRLSVIFVILLFLHPSSHVLKEQSNVDRHNPELCYNKMATRANTITISNSTATTIILPDSNLFAGQRRATRAPPGGNMTQLASDGGKILPATSEHKNENHQNNQGQQFNSIATRRLYYQHQLVNNHHLHSNKTSIDLNNNNDNIVKDNQTAKTTTSQNKPDPPVATVKLSAPLASGNNNNNITNSYYYNYSTTKLHNDYNSKNTTSVRAQEVDNETSANNQQQVRTDNDDEREFEVSSSNRFCLDPRPLFVAQSSICWYVLSIGLSCYLVDLILRKSRRSKSSIQLLDVRLDCEGNLIELILSNNHRRFAQWLPGQFVYLNCPQIATFEWHPFTISSMDNRTGQFTLHIKTGGDWTRKLRETLESMQNSMSNHKLPQKQLQYPNHHQQRQFIYPERSEIFVNPTLPRSYAPPVLPDFDCYNKTGKLQVECTKLVSIRNESERQQQEQQYDKSGDCLKVHLSNNNHQELYSICHNFNGDTIISHEKGLELYIDGPFHSPFERLLEQQVSVCIANGVGWTAFSSVFHCLTNNFVSKTNDATATTSWWSQWHNFANTTAHNTGCPISDTDGGYQIDVEPNFKKNSDTKLHLMVIVTSIEQLKPFYELALKYFSRIQDECRISVADQFNPVKEITAFLTRSTKDDQNIKEFCLQENLSILSYAENHVIRVNNLFTIHFGKPKFDFYLGAFSAIYPNSKKISVYCCGSYQVKKDVREICLNLNKVGKRQSKIEEAKELRPIYSYHEENF